MHGEVMDFLARVKQAHPEPFSGKRVLECGSYNINGTPRSLFQDCEYVGVDHRPGPDVNVVSIIHDFQDESGFDVIISAEMLEHDPYWDRSLHRIADLLRPEGCLLLTWAGPGRGPHELAVSPDPNYYGNRTMAEIIDLLRARLSWSSEMLEDHGGDIYCAMFGCRRR